MKLLELLEQYPGWTMDDGAQMRTVEEYVRDWRLSAPPEDRGPEVAALPSVDTGALTVMSLDAAHHPRERIGTLVPSGRRW